MAKQTGPSAAPERVAIYDMMVASQPEAERRGGAEPHTSMNGNTFSYLSKSGMIGLRLPSKQREQFIVKYQARLCFEQYGIVRPEYVEVPLALMEKPAVLKKYFAMSFEYAKTLKPRPPVKKKAKV